MRGRATAKGGAAAAIVGALLVPFSTACSAKDAAVAPTAVTLTFPSTAAAVASDTVEIRVFDESGADPSQACENLVAQQRSQQALPPALVDVNTSACALAGGGDPLTVSVGARAFLVTTASAGAELLIGCAAEDVAGGQLLVPVALILASDSVLVPATTCTSLSQHCSDGC